MMVPIWTYGTFIVQCGEMREDLAGYQMKFEEVTPDEDLRPKAAQWFSSTLLLLAQKHKEATCSRTLLESGVSHRCDYAVRGRTDR
jgi:hypothetical protein